MSKHVTMFAMLRKITRFEYVRIFVCAEIENSSNQYVSSWIDVMINGKARNTDEGEKEDEGRTCAPPQQHMAPFQNGRYLLATAIRNVNCLHLPKIPIEIQPH